MPIYVTGIDHLRTRLDVRERLAISEADYPAALRELRSRIPLGECVLLSTCNRSEIYLAAQRPLDSPALYRDFFRSFRNVEATSYESGLRTREGEEAVRHLFSVTAGLEAMVLGETQILGQAKRAYSAAYQSRTTGRILNRLFQHAFALAKRIHARTGISSYPASIPGLAASLAEKVFRRLSERVLVVVGAGETAALCVEIFRARGIGQIRAVNRTREHALALGDPITVYALDKLTDALRGADIAAFFVSAPAPLLSAPQAASAVASRRGEPFLILDMSVPRAVDPATQQLENCFYFNLDDLRAIAKENRRRIAKAEAEARSLVDREAAEYWQRNFGLPPARPHWEGLLQREAETLLLECRPDDRQALAEALDRNRSLVLNEILQRARTNETLDVRSLLRRMLQRPTEGRS